MPATSILSTRACKCVTPCLTSSGTRKFLLSCHQIRFAVLLLLLVVFLCLHVYWLAGGGLDRRYFSLFRDVVHRRIVRSPKPPAFQRSSASYDCWCAGRCPHAKVRHHHQVCWECAFQYANKSIDKNPSPKGFTRRPSAACRTRPRAQCTTCAL
jgi:hypothetical protein